MLEFSNYFFNFIYFSEIKEIDGSKKSEIEVIVDG